MIPLLPFIRNAASANEVALSIQNEDDDGERACVCERVCVRVSVCVCVDEIEVQFSAICGRDK